MAFFDNLGKKASEATAKAVQKAQGLSETTRLNSLISDEEKKLNNTYYQIGKLYVSLHGGDSEEDFVGMIASISESEKKISNYQIQIQELKGIQRCEKCGAEVTRGAAFCSSCGAPMPKVETAIADDCIKCENCGTSVKRGMRFCTSCGTPMTVTTVIQSISNTNDVNGIITEKICSVCGAKITEDAAFCTVCGASAPKTETMMAEDCVKCESCGASVKRGKRFCTSCGSAMIVIPPVQLDSNIEKIITEKTCPICGEKITDDMAFCIECGAKL